MYVRALSLSPPVPSPPPPSLFSLVEAVHVPFCQLLIRYPLLEQQTLTSRLRHLQLVGGANDLLNIKATLPQRGSLDHIAAASVHYT